MLTRPEDDNYYEFLLGNYTTIRRFLPLLLRTVQFEGAKAGQPALKAIEFLRDIEGHSRSAMSGAPHEVVNRAWQKLVIQPDGVMDRSRAARGSASPWPWAAISCGPRPEITLQRPRRRLDRRTGRQS